jgi:hypothetical protein
MNACAYHQPAEAATSPRAAGVTYSTIPGVSGDFFRCGPYKATVSTSACAKRWRKAQTAKSFALDTIHLCRGCSLGSIHSGERPIKYSVLYEAGICARCGRNPGRRLIGGRQCPSCYNRARELRIGKNGKGTAPVKLAPLDRRSIRFAIEGASVEELTIDQSKDMVELMLAVLSRTRGRVLFHFSASGPAGMPEAA